jgi:SynChlorMet cassette protein ScmC
MAAGGNQLLDKVASIMRLGNGTGYDCPKLILAGKISRVTEGPIGRPGSGVNDRLPREGWQATDCGSMLIWSHREVEDVIYENAVDEDCTHELNQICSYLFPVYRKVIESGGMPVHAALVELNGTGVMLAAPGDTGKSTCCRRLPPPWKVLGDEEAIVIKDHEGRFLAHPFPTWSDIYERGLKKSWDVRKSARLKAVFFLEQSGIVEVLPIGRGQAVMQLNHLAREKLTRGWWCDNAKDVERLTRRVFGNACDLVQKVPSYILRTNLTGRFWEEIEEIIR